MSFNNSLKNKVTDKLSACKSYIYMCVCVYKLDLTLNNPRGLICHKITTKQPTILSVMVALIYDFWKSPFGD